MARESPLQSGFKSHSHKRRNARFKGLRWVHTPPQPLTAHTAAHRAKHGRFGWGVVSLPSERSARSQTSPGRVSERHTLPLFGLGRMYSQRTQKAFGTAMRLCASLLRGVAAPLGCVIPLLFLSPHRWASRFCLATITACRERYSPVSHAGLLHASCHALPFLCPVHSIHLSLIKLVNGKLDRQDRVE